MTISGTVIRMLGGWWDHGRSGVSGLTEAAVVQIVAPSLPPRRESS